MRHLPTVIDAMLAVIPAQHGLISTLEDIKSSSVVAAPEMMRHWWQEVAYALEEFFPANPADFSDWQQIIIKIWQNQT